MPEISVARTITVVQLPDASQAIIKDTRRPYDPPPYAPGAVKELSRDALSPARFETAEEKKAMDEVGGFIDGLSDKQAELLLLALQNAVDEEQGHLSSVQFLQLNSGYEIEGVGLEIRNDTVTEEKVFSPIRVMFVSWNQ